MSKKFNFIKKQPGIDAEHDANIVCVHDQTLANGAVRFTVTSNGILPTFNVGGNTAISEGNNIYVADTDFRDLTTLDASGDGFFDVHVYQGNVTLKGQVYDVAEYGGAGGNLRAETGTVTVSGLTNFQTDHAQNAEVFISSVTCETVLPEGTTVDMTTTVTSGNIIQLDGTLTVDSAGNITCRNVILEPNVSYTTNFVNADRSNTSIDTSFQVDAQLSPFFTLYDPTFADNYASASPVNGTFNGISGAAGMDTLGGLAMAPVNTGVWLGAPNLENGNACVGHYDEANATLNFVGNGGSPGDASHIGTFCNVASSRIESLEYTGAVAKHDGNVIMFPGNELIGTLRQDVWAEVMSWSGIWYTTAPAGPRGEAHGNLSTTYSVGTTTGTSYINRHGAALAPTGDVYVAPFEESAIAKYDASTNTVTHVSGANVAITRANQNTNNRMKAYGKPVTATNGKIYMPGYAQYNILELNPGNDTYGDMGNGNTVPGTYAFNCGAVIDEHKILFVGEKWTDDVRDFATSPTFSTQIANVTAFGVANVSAGTMTISDFDVEQNSANNVGRGGAVSAQRSPDGNIYVTTPSGSVISYVPSSGSKTVIFSARDVAKNGGNVDNAFFSCTNALLTNDGGIMTVPTDNSGSYDKQLSVNVLGQSGANTWPRSAYHSKN